MIFCPNCSAELPPFTARCLTCGADLTESLPVDKSLQFTSRPVIPAGELLEGLSGPERPAPSLPPRPAPAPPSTSEAPERVREDTVVQPPDLLDAEAPLPSTTPTLDGPPPEPTLPRKARGAPTRHESAAEIAAATGANAAVASRTAPPAEVAPPRRRVTPPEHDPTPAEAPPPNAGPRSPEPPAGAGKSGGGGVAVAIALVLILGLLGVCGGGGWYLHDQGHLDFGASKDKASGGADDGESGEGRAEKSGAGRSDKQQQKDKKDKNNKDIQDDKGDRKARGGKGDKRKDDKKEKADKDARKERPEQNDKGNKSDKGDKNDKNDKGDRGGKEERGGKGDKKDGEGREESLKEPAARNADARADAPGDEALAAWVRHRSFDVGRFSGFLHGQDLVEEPEVGHWAVVQLLGMDLIAFAPVPGSDPEARAARARQALTAALVAHRDGAGTVAVFPVGEAFQLVWQGPGGAAQPLMSLEDEDAAAFARFAPGTTPDNAARARALAAWITAVLDLTVLGERPRATGDDTLDAALGALRKARGPSRAEKLAEEHRAALNRAAFLPPTFP